MHHYFGTKTQLFAAAIHIPIDPMAVIGPLREVPIEQIGYVLPSILLPLWDSEMGKGFIATLRSILAGNEVSLIRSFLQDVIAVEVGSRVDNPPGSGRIRVQFVASQLVGVVMARYILELEPFESLPVEQIAETIAPNLQRYLTGELTRSSPERARSSRRSCSRRRSPRPPRRRAAPGCRPRSGMRGAVAGCTETRRPDQQQRPAVLRADQDAQQFFVEHADGSADRQVDEAAWIVPPWSNGAGAPPMAKPG